MRKIKFPARNIFFGANCVLTEMWKRHKNKLIFNPFLKGSQKNIEQNMCK